MSRKFASVFFKNTQGTFGLDGTAKTVTFTNLYNNTNDIANLTTGIVTIDEDGLYYVCAQLSTESSDTLPTEYTDLYLFKNSTQICQMKRGDGHLTTRTNFRKYLRVGTLVRASSGDTFSIKALSDVTVNIEDAYFNVLRVFD